MGMCRCLSVCVCLFLCVSVHHNVFPYKHVSNFVISEQALKVHVSFYNCYFTFLLSVTYGHVFLTNPG